MRSVPQPGHAQLLGIDVSRTRSGCDYSPKAPYPGEFARAYGPQADLDHPCCDSCHSLRPVHLAVALESGTGDDIEHAKRAVTVFRGVAAPLSFQEVNVLGIKLRPTFEQCWYWAPERLEQPGDLVSAADVQLIVDHVGAGR